MNLFNLPALLGTIGHGQKLIMQIGNEYFDILGIFERDDEWYLVVKHPTRTVINVDQVDGETIFLLKPAF